VNYIEQLAAIEAALDGKVAVPQAEDDLVKANISWGYSPLQGQLSLLLDLTPGRPGTKLVAFAAVLEYEPTRGWMRCAEPRRAYSSANPMDTDLIRTQLSINAPDRRPLKCRWKVLASVEVGFNDHRHWMKEGAFVQP
jgi:hypothetical protein